MAVIVLSAEDAQYITTAAWLPMLPWWQHSGIMLQCAELARTASRVTHPTIAEDPVLLAQWDHKRNADHGHSPDKVRLKAHKHIFWLCNKCPAGQEHSWSTRPIYCSGRSKTGCPFCAGHRACRCNSLLALHPSIAAEWDHDRNKVSA